VRAALDIAAKDLRQKVRDRSALLIGIVAPFALAALFAMVLGGVDDDFHARWAYVDLDGGDIAAALDEGPLRSVEQAGVVTIDRLDSAAEARAAVDAGDVDAAIILPDGFSASVRAGSGSAVELVVDPDAAISGQVARSLLAGFASRVDAVQLSVTSALMSARQLPDAVAIAALAEQAGAMADPVTIVDAAADDRRAGSATYYAASMAILFVFLAAQFGILSVHAERRSRTLARMLAAPLRWQSILAGKLIVSMVMALMSLGVIVIGTALLLGARWGDPLGITALVVAAAMAATGISLLTVGFTRNEEQAGSAIAIVSITLAVVGGSFFPANQGPELLSQLSLLTPHAWFLDGVSDVSTGGDIVSAAPSILFLVAVAIVTGGLGMLRARRLVLS
jgi:ABC-2 type transport system permease protein